MPSLLTLIGDKPFAWSLVNKGLLRHNKERLNRLIASDFALQEDINFYDVIDQYKGGNQKYRALYEYFDGLLVQLNRQMPKEKKELLLTTLYSMLTSFNIDFLHFVGELSVLNKLLSEGYQLMCVEEIMPHGKRVDFTMQAPNSSTLRIEIVNLRLWSQKEKSDHDIVRFLQGKILGKLNDKTQNNVTNHIFYTIPVMWGSVQMLRRVRDLYEPHLNMQKIAVIEPVAYASICYDETPQIWFGSLRTLRIE